MPRCRAEVEETRLRTSGEHPRSIRLLDIDHERLTYFYQGRRFRLTDVFGKVMEDLLTCRAISARWMVYC